MSARVVDLDDVRTDDLGPEVLGAKAAGLVTLRRLGLPVPPGFVVTTSVGREHLRTGSLAPVVRAEIRAARERLEASVGRRLGDPRAPLVVAVRSGAATSMPGMMDTVLDIGAPDVADASVGPDEARFAWDNRRRFLRSYATAVFGLDDAAFAAVDAEVAASGAAAPGDLARGYEAVIAAAGRAIPADPHEQLEHAVEAVLASWDAPRARTYRQLHDLDDGAGTAVTVQAMVFGNRDEHSATGVAFSRDPASGEPQPYGDVLFDAQGEDVVAGRATPQPLSELADREPAVWEQLRGTMDQLEHHLGDLVMVEFTVESGTLWLLQVRRGGATDAAAVRIAVDLVDRGVIEHDEAVRRTTPAELRACLEPPPVRRGPRDRLTRGLGASPGVATGRVATDADQALRLAGSGPVILVRPVTSPVDVHGMGAAAGILTATGGLASHAAIVARSMGKPAVVGARDVVVDAVAGTVTIGDHVLRAGDDVVSVDGTTGEVVLGGPDAGTSSTTIGRPRHLERLLRWADAIADGPAPGATDEERLAAAQAVLGSR